MGLEELKQVLGKIDELRKLLNKVINESEGLHDDKVIAISKHLDFSLNEYYTLIKEKENKNA